MTTDRSRRDGPALALTAWVTSVILALLGASVAAACFAVAAVIRGDRSPEAIRAEVESAPATWAAILASQAATLVVLLVAARVARVPLRDRAGLGPAGLSGVQRVLVVTAVIIPFAVGVLAAAGVNAMIGPIFGGGENALTRMWAEGSRVQSVGWVLLIAIVPGVVEEVFYRGFLLRTLLLSWSPRRAILVSSVLFGLAHVEPSQVAFTFCVGVWFGVVAWRTGSVVIPAVMHALMNGGWTAVQMVRVRGDVPERIWEVAAIVVVAAGMAAFIPAIAILRKPGPTGDTPRSRAWPTWGRLAGIAMVAVISAPLLYAVVPPGRSAASKGAAPSEEWLRANAGDPVAWLPGGEIAFTLTPDSPVRLALPANPSGVDEVLIQFDQKARTIWLFYGGEVSGKGARGLPRGILEQLSGDHAVWLRISFADVDARPLSASSALLTDPEHIAKALEAAERDAHWAVRGRRASAPR